jgi:membrane associated rhomboid family serine protease
MLLVRFSRLWYDRVFMRRGPSYSSVSYAFGPGPVSLAVKYLIVANVAMFLVSLVYEPIIFYLGLIPADVVERYRLWQIVTYMFLHGGVLHILLNMLALWMFGTELERLWGTRFFLKYYFVTGIGAALLTLAFAVLPWSFGARMFTAVTIGASGAIYGLLLAYGLYFPDRPIYVYAIFPIKAKYFVMIFGAVAFLSSISGSGGGVSHTAHLGGLLVGYLYLKGLRLHPLAELKYRYLKWKINRTRRKFDVYSGGRADDWDRRIH